MSEIFSTQEHILASLSLCYVLASIQVRVLSVLCGEIINMCVIVRKIHFLCFLCE